MLPLWTSNIDIQTECFKTKDINYIPRYTYGAWAELFPETEYSDWSNYCEPLNVFDFIDKSVSDIDLNSKIRVVVLDEDYVAWLKGRENTPELRREYCESMDAEEADAKIKTEEMNAQITLAFMLIGLSKTKEDERFPRETHFALPAATRREMANCIRSKSRCLTFVSTHLYSIEDIMSEGEERQKIYADISESIDDGTPDVLSPDLSCQHHKEEYKRIILCAPVMLIGEIPSATICLADKDGVFLDAITPEFITYSALKSLIPEEDEVFGPDVEVDISARLATEDTITILDHDPNEEK